MSETNSSSGVSGTLHQYMDRRGFLRNSAAAGAGLLLTSKSAIAQEATRELKIGLIGCGAQGNALMNATRQIEGIRFTAVCDIWDYNRNIMAKRLNAYKMPVKDYDDIDVMLDTEKDVDAFLIATPDFMHAPYTRKVLEKGKPVYCEKMMSNSIEAARDMVKAQRETKGILQIGHQRHSNYRYLHLRDKLFNEHKLLGRMTHANAQWNRAVKNPEAMVAGREPKPEVLQKYGYGSLDEFANWRMYKKYGGGAIADLGAHQIDLFLWMLGKTPKSVVASGGIDYYKGIEHYDNVMCIYEFDTPDGVVRCSYQVLTTNSSQGFYEKFMGDEGTAVISENPAYNRVWREAGAKASWEPMIKEGLILPAIDAPVYNRVWEQPKPWTRATPWMAGQSVTDVRETKGADPYDLPKESMQGKAYHQPHLLNFYEAVRAQDATKLHCPVEEAFRTCVAVLTVNEAIAQGKKIEFKPEDFIVA